MRRASRPDSNHAEIREGLRDIFGTAAVQDVSMYPGLGFDLIAYIGGSIAFLEVKQPQSRDRLTDSEIAARLRYGNIWHVVTTLEEALAVIGAA